METSADADVLNLTLADCSASTSVGTVTETGTETAVFWQYRTEAKPRF